jgi:hypothetical protein
MEKRFIAEFRESLDRPIKTAKIFGNNEIRLKKDINGEVWFNMVNENGGTARPYGFATIEEIKELRNIIDKILEEE